MKALKALAGSMLTILAVQAWAEDCKPSVVITRDDGVVVEGSSTTPRDRGCSQTDFHVDPNTLESKSRVINSDGSANPAGEEFSISGERGAAPGKGKLRLEKKGPWSHETGSAQFSGEWPDNEYTRRIPRPDIPFNLATVDPKRHRLGVLFKKNDGVFNAMKGYVEKLKAHGYTNNAESKEKTANGQPFFSYSAYDGAGYLVQVSCWGDGCRLGLYTPEGAAREAEREAKREPKPKLTAKPEWKGGK
jgi:hypothetical protein